MLLYLYTKLFINMIILYYQMCLNSEQDFTASPHEIFHETSLGPDALFITTKKFLFNYKVVFQYIYVKHILLNYSYPGFKRGSLNSTKKSTRFNSLLKCPLLGCQVFLIYMNSALIFIWPTYMYCYKLCLVRLALNTAG